jgi:hypothetical protein
MSTPQHSQVLTVAGGSFGGYERGWVQVSAWLDWAAAGIKATDRLAGNVVMRRHAVELPGKDEQRR